MTGSGTVERIFIAPEAEAEMDERTDVEAVAGKGLRGDRYFGEIESGTFVEWGSAEERRDGYDLTLIEQEAVTAIEREAGIELAPGEHRRNVETRDVALNHLVGRRFRVGDAEGTACVNRATTSSASLGTAYCRRSLTEEGSGPTFSRTGRFAPETSSNRSSDPHAFVWKRERAPPAAPMGIVDVFEIH